MVPKGYRERIRKYFTIYMYVFFYPKLNKLVRGKVHGVAVSVYNSPIHMQVEKVKFRNNCSLK